MQFVPKLTKGKILKRYKRFLSDIELPNGEIIVAHTPNTGSMKSCWEPGWTACISQSNNPNRKLPYTLELTHNGHTWINVNTSLTNKLAVEAIQNGTIAELQNYPRLITEQKIERGRIDILLQRDEQCCYVEVKNVTLLGKDNKATFPDSVSARGRKHLQELTRLKREGHRACMLFIVSREDTNAFGPAFSLDPEYGEELVRAQSEGVEMLAYQCSINEREILVTRSLPLKIDPTD